MAEPLPDLLALRLASKSMPANSTMGKQQLMNHMQVYHGGVNLPTATPLANMNQLAQMHEQDHDNGDVGIPHDHPLRPRLTKESGPDEGDQQGGEVINQDGEESLSGEPLAALSSNLLALTWPDEAREASTRSLR